MRKLVVALGVAIALAPPARAAWDRTEWGMALTTLQQLYPGGKRVEQTYAVRHELAGHPVVVVMKIGPDGLQQVAIVFPGAEASVELAAPAQAREPTPRARKTWSDVRGVLEEQYGKPATEGESLVAWSSPIDSVVLTRTDDAATGLSRVALTYMPANAVDEVVAPPPARSGDGAGRGRPEPEGVEPGAEHGGGERDEAREAG